MHKVILIEDIENAENKTLYCVFNEKIDEIDCIKLKARFIWNAIYAWKNMHTILNLI